MRSSIGWTLIGWYGLVLTFVLGVLGTTLYWQAAATTMDGTDAALADRARAIVAALEWDERDAAWELELSDDYLRGIAADAFFSIRAPDGTLLRSGGDPAPGPGQELAALRASGDLREVELPGVRGARVVVGRSIAAERAALRRLLATVVGAGLAVLLFALWIGRSLTKRTLAPVAAMTRTAASIDVRDLSARLDEESCPLELRGLARSFNEALARLEGAFERQSRFTADASHELRTPVAVIRAQVELALQRDRTLDQYRATLQACLRAAERMTGVVESLLVLARSDAGQGHAGETVALDEIVREVVALHRPAAEAEGVTLESGAEPVTVSGDARLLVDLLSNLVSNGVRYNRPGGSVKVALGREDGLAVVRVRDTGIGIPEEALPHVFERFFRVDRARSRERGGTGLGLSIASWIAELHGGSIEVESRPDAGSTFTVRLPAK